MMHPQLKKSARPANGWKKDDQPCQINNCKSPCPDFNTENYGIPAAVPGIQMEELDRLVLELKPECYKKYEQTQPAADKNTPTSLKTLRWAIYEAIDNYSGDVCATVRGCIKMKVEELFKEYTDS